MTISELRLSQALFNRCAGGHRYQPVVYLASGARRVVAAAASSESMFVPALVDAPMPEPAMKRPPRPRRSTLPDRRLQLRNASDKERPWEDVNFVEPVETIT